MDPWLPMVPVPMTAPSTHNLREFMATSETEVPSQQTDELAKARDRKAAIEAKRNRVREVSHKRNQEIVPMPRWGFDVIMMSVNVEEQRRIFSEGYTTVEVTEHDPFSGESITKTVSKQTPDLYPLAISASAYVEEYGELEPLVPRGPTDADSLHFAREFVNQMHATDANALFRGFLRAIGETEEQKEEGKGELSATNSNGTGSA